MFITDLARCAFVQDRIHVRSGFLALWCLEAVVPLLALAAAAAEAVAVRHELREGLFDTLQVSIFGATNDTILPWLDRVLGAASWQGVGLFGAVSALFVGYQLYVAVLFDLGELQRAGPSQRSWALHAALYPVFLVWVTVLVLGGLVGTSLVFADGHVYLWPGVWLTSTLCLFVGPRWFGRSALPWRSRLGGAAVGATWLELVKGVFVAYSTSRFGSDALASIYRDLAFVPLAMLWMHLLWFSVLLGSVAGRYLDARQEVTAPSAA